jgi:hypothetical protein
MNILAALIVAIAFCWFTREGGWWDRFTDRLDRRSTDE